MGATAAWKLMAGFAGGVTADACATERRAATGPRRSWTRSLALGVVLLALAPDVSFGGVLTESDFQESRNHKAAVPEFDG